LKFQSKFQRRLMLMGSLVIGIAEAGLDQAQVDSGVLGFFDGGHVDRYLRTRSLTKGNEFLLLRYSGCV
jgi:hypothetical protein